MNNTVSSMLVLALTLSACGYPQPGSNVSTPPAGNTLATAGLGLTAQVEYAIDELSRREHVAPDHIAVNSARQVQWSSSALGCPDPNKSYMQVITPGVLIILGAGEKHYRYHGSVGARPFLCPDDRAKPPGTGPGGEFM